MCTRAPSIRADSRAAPNRSLVSGNRRNFCPRRRLHGEGHVPKRSCDSIQTSIALIPVVCDTLAVAGCLYLLVAAIAVLRFGRGGRTPPQANAHRPVSILKPLHGFEPHLE